MTTAPATLNYSPTLGQDTRPKSSLLPKICFCALTLILLIEATMFFAPTFIPERFWTNAYLLVPMAGLALAGISIGLSAVTYYTKWERIILFALGLTVLPASALCLTLAHFVD